MNLFRKKDKKLDKTKKNRYVPFKKTIIPVLTILMVITAILIFIYTIDLNKFKKLHTRTYDETYIMHVLYLVMDKDNVPNDINLEQTFHGEVNYDEHILTTSSSAIPLTRKGDYLYADLDKFTHPELLKYETDYAFTKTNVNGELIDGCYYDKKKNVIKVPVSYFEDASNDNEMPIQLEIETLMKQSTFRNLKTDVNIKRLITKSKTTTNDGNDVSTFVSLKTLGLGKISSKDVHVYLNNSKEEIDNQLIDVEDNELEIYVPALQIRHLDVKVDYSIQNVAAIKVVKSKSDFRAIKVSGPISVSKGKILKFPKGTYQYCTSGCFKPKGMDYWAFKSENANYYYTYAPYNGSWAVSTAKSYSRPYTYRIKVNTLISLLSGGTVTKVGKLSGTNQTWLALYCVDHTTKNGSGDFQIKVTSVTKQKNAIVIGLKSTEARGGQHAAGYLRFKWTDVGIKVKKSDDTGTIIQGLKITAEDMSDSTLKYTATTDASGYANFTNLNKSHSYKFYEDCNSIIKYNGKSNTTLDAQDIYCSWPESNPLDNGGRGYNATETVASESKNKYLFIGDEFYGSLVDNGDNLLNTLGDNINVVTAEGSSPSDWKNIPNVGSGTVNGYAVILPQPSAVSKISIMLGFHGIDQEEDYKTFIENLHTRYPNSEITINSVLRVNDSIYTAISNTDIEAFNAAMQTYCEDKDWLTYSDVSTELYGEYYGTDQQGSNNEEDFEGDDNTEEDEVLIDEDDGDEVPTDDDPIEEEPDQTATYHYDYTKYFNSDGYTLNEAGRQLLLDNIDSTIPYTVVTAGTTVEYSMDNVRYRKCLTASKTKGTSKRLEKNATMRVFIGSGVCKNYSSGFDQTFVTGDGTNGDLGFITVNGLGYCTPGASATVTIMDDEHKRTVIGSDHQQVSLVRSQIIVTANRGLDYRGKHYAKGDEVVMKDADLTSALESGLVVEVCPKTAPGEFEDKGYVVSWVKTNQTHRTNAEPSPMEGVKFTLTKGSTTIRVLKNRLPYTDVDGTSYNCYEYTDLTNNTTTTELESDSDGRVCVYNLPDTEPSTYTITEVTTDVYDNQVITATSSEEFANYENTKYLNYEYLIDWNKKELKSDKTSNSDGNLENTKFNVSDSTNVIVKTKPDKETIFDKNGVSKSCYVVDLVNTSNNTNSDFYSDANGYTCIVGLKNNETYNIVEKDPSEYYAYANVDRITEESKLVFNTANVNPKTIYQCPTEVKITKTTTELNNANDEYKKLVYEELQKLTFNVLDSNGNVLTFKWNNNTKHYEYQKAVNDLTGTTDVGTTQIRLLNGIDVQNTSLSDMDLNMFINYLPEGNYILREVSSINCGTTGSDPANGSNCTCENNTPNASQSTTEETNCSSMGYAHVADIRFTVTDENNGSSLTCDKTDNSVKVSLTNKPTKVKFTKEDFYGYYNDADTVKFENDEEIKAFDNIIFRIRKHSTITSGTNSTDSSNYEWFYKTYDGDYRYDVLHRCSSEGQRVGSYTCTQNLYTKNGDMNISHLCKCETYDIEEYEVPDGTVFILPKLEGDNCSEGYMKVDKNGKLECHPTKTIKVCDCDDDEPESSPPVKIEDFPTKQAFIKKDLKYNTIITDQRTTFELFLTKEGKTCNPYDETSKANDCIQVYFSDRVVLSDEEDGSYSYRMNPDQSANNKIKDLHVDPNTGKLIFRYLPSYIDREYVLMETKAPKGYDLPKGEKSVTRFRVLNDTVNVEISNVPNKPSKAIIGKYDVATGKLIPGFKFKVYKVNNYDENVTPMMQTKTLLEFKTIRDGSYEYREVYDTNLVTTCTDRFGSPCSNISNTLVNDEYQNTNMGTFESATTIQEGQALIQYLDTNTYYVLEEVEAPKGYKLPERESDRYTLFYIPEVDDVSIETKIYNTETYFTFFKFDEYNNAKDGAVFKLQKLNNDKVYEDVAVEDMSTDVTKMYKISSESTNYDITTINGQATIYRLTEGQYRIIETRAPEGYELPKKTYNVVTFLVDAKGHTFGSNIIANKKKSTKTITYPTASAELVINVQTGKKVIKYGLIITGILGLIGLLIFIKKRINK